MSLLIYICFINNLNNERLKGASYFLMKDQQKFNQNPLKKYFYFMNDDASHEYFCNSTIKTSFRLKEQLWLQKLLLLMPISLWGS